MRAPALFFATLIGFFCAPALAQQEKTAFSDLVVLAPKLAHLQNQFEQMATPGVSIEAREVFRKGASGVDLQVRYNIYVKGVSPESVFRQLQWPVDREKPANGLAASRLTATAS